MQLRMSPGGNDPSSSRNRPELPPSSVTVTMTDRCPGPFFKPRNNVDSPVPPPIETILGPLGKALFFGEIQQLFETGLLVNGGEVVVLGSLKAILGSMVKGLFEIGQGLIDVAS